MTISSSKKKQDGCHIALWHWLIGFKKIEPVRRDPIKTAEEVLKDPEARERVKYALQIAPPGTKLRWDKLLAITNRVIEPTDEIWDPLRIDIDMDELKKVLRDFYRETSSVTSDGIKLMRVFLPQLYNKHSVERGRRVSQKEREEKGLIDECFAYGEVDYEILATIMMKIKAAWGEREKGVFYDLGCGVGQLVYAAALVGSWKKCVGVENVIALLERGSKRMSRWETYSENFPKLTTEIEMDFVDDNFLENDFWVEATFIFLHWTAFSNEQISKSSSMFSYCPEGTIVIAFTNPVPNDDFEILIKDSCLTSWGEAEFFIQEKLTVAKPRPIQ